MGFIKKFFSLGSKKSKKRTPLDIPPPLPTKDVSSRDHLTVTGEDPEVVASRLLRSSSAHFAVVSKVDYSSLPPIPHPINTIKSTATATPSRSPSVQTKSTYTVTIHARTQHSRTEFPNANPPLNHQPKTIPKNNKRENNDTTTPTTTTKEPRQSKSSFDPRKVPFTPRDRNRLNRLRQDPSVVSLVKLYDDHGQLDEHAFSNTPPAALLTMLSDQTVASVADTTFRPKPTRRASTLRDLLGDCGNAADISWAEKCLGEKDDEATSDSSFGVDTPVTEHFELEKELDKNITLMSNTTLDDSAANYRTFSSLEVELSSDDSRNFSDDTDNHPANKTQEKIPRSPAHNRTPSLRASQVFSFLAEKRPPNSKQGVSAWNPIPVSPNLRRNSSLMPNDNRASSSTATAYTQQRHIPNQNVANINNSYLPTNIYIPANPLPTQRLEALELPIPQSQQDYQRSGRGLSTSPASVAPLRPKARSIDARELIGSRSRTPVEYLTVNDTGESRPRSVTLLADDASSLRPPVGEQTTGASTMSGGSTSTRSTIKGPRGPRPPSFRSSMVFSNHAGESTSNSTSTHAFSEAGHLNRAALGEVTNRANSKSKNSSVGSRNHAHSLSRAFSARSQTAPPEADRGFRIHPDDSDELGELGNAMLLANESYESKESEKDIHNAKRRYDTDRYIQLTPPKKSLQIAPLNVERGGLKSENGQTAFKLNANPNSSTELSPVAKQMMAELRTRRAKARTEFIKRSGGRHAGSANGRDGLRLAAARS